MKQAWILGVMLALAGGQVWADDWPYPEDTPAPVPVSVGVAGDYPADISRFLMARGARSVAPNTDGSAVAYVSSVTGVPQIWIAPTAGGQPHQLTFGGGVTFFRWHPDGTHLLYGADNNGDEREAYYLISTDGKSERVILPASDAYRAFGDFDGEGKRIVYASTERTGRDFDIYVADLDTGTAKLVYQAEFGFMPQSWQPGTDTVVVAETRGEDAADVHLLNVATGEMKALYKPKVAAAYTGFNWTPDGKKLYFASNVDGEYAQVMVYEPTSGKTESFAPAAAKGVDIDEVALCGGGRYLAWTTNEGGYSKLHLYDFKYQRMAGTPYLPDGVMSLNWALGHYSALAITVSGPASPGDSFVWRVTDGRMDRVLTPDMAGLDASRMVRPEAITFKARDGVTVHGLLYLPQGAEKPPVVVDVHGGPTAQARPEWASATQYLVGRGIAVLDINVRGSTGYGKTYTRLDNQEKRLDSVRDLADAVAWLKKDGRVDGTRAAVMGGSYGGYMVNAVMGLYPGTFRAGVSIVGVSDWVRALEEASPGLKASDRIEYGDIREKKWQDFYAVNSPINTVGKIEGAMMFSHGVNDPRDPVTESDRMVKALRDKGQTVDYLRWPDEGHSVRKLSNRLIMYRRVAHFLETQLGVKGQE
ncbi:S9 family peptidase [Pseudokordiimonas caeni]|uniref:S9 family peptidase n=1 Tax=Pseudokordiimonas caeni TaxID=2997908 RepID=UPI002810D569|nr:prolyl oligopeptidase family serine peptidase [Pseudokordiimonas caeni]